MLYMKISRSSLTNFTFLSPSLPSPVKILRSIMALRVPIYSRCLQHPVRSKMTGLEGGGESTEATVPQQTSSSNEHVMGSQSEKLIVRHQQSLSLDGSTFIKPELLISGVEWTPVQEPRKGYSTAKLAEIALLDPKRVKRILTNRQSALRSQERKMHYISELEKKLKALQTEEITLSTQLAMAKRYTTGLKAENNELKVRLQSMEEQIQLQVAVNNILKDEVQRLAMGGMENPNEGHMKNDGTGFIANEEFYPYNNEMCNLITTQQLQQLQICPPLQPNLQVQCQPPNFMRNGGPVAPNHMGLDLVGSLME